MGLWGTVGGFLTLIAASLAAYFARNAANAASKSYLAFVAAEDASLSVEFPDGSLGESFVEGVKVSETYNLTAKVTNIGRSTARLHYCSIGEHRILVDRTLKKEEEHVMGWEVPVETLEPFDFLIHYSSPIRPAAVLTVAAQVVKQTHMPQLIGRVINTKISDESERK